MCYFYFRVRGSPAPLDIATPTPAYAYSDWVGKCFWKNQNRHNIRFEISRCPYHGFHVGIACRGCDTIYGMNLYHFAVRVTSEHLWCIPGRQSRLVNYKQWRQKQNSRIKTQCAEEMHLYCISGAFLVHP